jgi:hypothetical protein
MSEIERDESERCPKCGKPSASPPAEVYCVECATEGWQEDAIAHLRHQLAGAVDTLAEVRLYAEKMLRSGDGNTRIHGADLLAIIDRERGE